MDGKRIQELSIHAFIKLNGIKNEVGNPIDFKDHPFLWDIYKDFSPKLVVTKAAQVGATTMETIKLLWAVRNRGLDAIYCLPTYEDVNTLVGSKVNRIIAQNPIFQQWTSDKDTIDQKQIGDHYIHWRGTWTSKAAIMVSSDWNLYDEIDACKPDVVEQYATRLQHSPYKYEHYFSHPSAQGTGIDRYWERSNQRHWFVSCSNPGCCREQYLSWPESIDEERGQFVCKFCKGELSDNDRRRGRWIARYKDREYSGYWIPLLICPWVSAREILSYKKDKSEEYFANKVLGIPYTGGGNKLTRQHFFQNLTEENLYPETNERCVMGLDTGTQLYFVLMSERGMFHYGVAKDYTEIEEMIKRWPRMMVVADQGGDLIGVRALKEKYPGRVYLCVFTENKNTKEEAKWGRKDDEGWVQVDRNRTMSEVVASFQDKRIPVMGKEEDWAEYFSHWNNLTRVNIFDPVTNTLRSRKWVKNGQSDFPFATLYARIGLDRFVGIGSILMPKTGTGIQEQPNILPGKRMKQTKPIELILEDTKSKDWRI